MAETYRYQLTRVCLRSGVLHLPVPLRAVFPDRADVLVKDVDRDEDHLAHVEGHRLIGLGTLLAAHDLMANDELVIRPLSVDEFAITVAKRPRRLDLSRPQTTAAVVDQLLSLGVPLSEDEIREIHPHLPPAFPLRQELEREPRLMRRAGRWQPRLPEGRPAPAAESPARKPEPVRASAPSRSARPANPEPSPPPAPPSDGVVRVRSASADPPISTPERVDARAQAVRMPSDVRRAEPMVDPQGAVHTSRAPSPRRRLDEHADRDARSMRDAPPPPDFRPPPPARERRSAERFEAAQPAGRPKATDRDDPFHVLDFDGDPLASADRAVPSEPRAAAPKRLGIAASLRKLVRTIASDDDPVAPPAEAPFAPAPRRSAAVPDAEADREAAIRARVLADEAEAAPVSVVARSLVREPAAPAVDASAAVVAAPAIAATPAVTPPASDPDPFGPVPTVDLSARPADPGPSRVSAVGEVRIVAPVPRPDASSLEAAEGEPAEAAAAFVALGFRIEWVTPRQFLVVGELGRRAIRALVHVLDGSGPFDWTQLTIRRRDVGAVSALIVGEERALKLLLASASLARVTLWTWLGLRRAVQHAASGLLSPLDLEPHFDRDGLFEYGFDRLERQVARGIDERRSFWSVLSLLARHDRPAVVRLDEVAVAVGIGREQAARVLERLAEAPWSLVQRFDATEFGIRLAPHSVFTAVLRDLEALPPAESPDAAPDAAPDALAVPTEASPLPADHARATEPAAPAASPRHDLDPGILIGDADTRGDLPPTRVFAGPGWNDEEESDEVDISLAARPKID